MVELGVADAVASRSLARVHARPAHLVGHVEEMELVGRASLLEQRTHPSS
jgi:hypothetical protein